MTQAPAQLASFEIIRRLGAGGMAEVFLAKKRGAEGTFKLLVVKRILPQHASSRRFRSMFVEEAHLATRLNHPNIVQVYEFSDHGDEGLLLSMEYVEGFDLGKLMSAAKQKSAKIPPLVAAFIVSEAAKGLHYAHERRDEGGAPLAIVHRDVSPQNIIISVEGVVKIADFGIASANLFREEPGVLKGKFGYMSPEQARGERVDRRSDIYALGVVLYELLTLRSPYAPPGQDKPTDDALLEAVRGGKIVAPSAQGADVPGELEAIALRALSMDSSERFQTARDMSGALMRLLVAKQELVDSASVEHVLVALLGRDALVQSVPPPSEAAQLTQAAAPQARTSGGAKLEGSRAASPRRAREVRHVAVLLMHIEGLDVLEARLGPLAAKRVTDQLKQTLDHIAYKRGTRFSWEPGEGTLRGGTAIVGLMSNPSRAPFEAASLAIDVHEALAGTSEDLPLAISAAIGIVRGIALGERDDQGHLSLQKLEEPAPFLAERVGAAAPRGKTWVAGGLYRLVRRDFRWGDAPTLDLGQVEGRDVPRHMRIYALIRPLTREERAAEMALAPNDLVGRDAEKADLHAAYHRAVAATSSPGQSTSAAPPPLSVAPAMAAIAARPKSEAPKSEAPKSEAPKSEAPKSEAPKSEGGTSNAGPISDRRAPDAPTASVDRQEGGTGDRDDAAHAGAAANAVVPVPASPVALSPVSVPPVSVPPVSVPPVSLSPASLSPGSGGRISVSSGPLSLSAPPSKLSTSPPAGRGKLIARAVVGELGIGKTALVATFLSEIPRDARVISIECSPVKSEIPLATLCDLVRESTGVGIDHSLEEAGAVFRGILGQLVARSSLSERLISRLSEVATGKQVEDAEEDQGNYRRDLLFIATRFLLGALALEQPLVVVIDGLQWADRASLELLQDLLRREERLPILVILVTRPEERAQPFIEGLVRIELRGLGEEEQVRLVEARLGVREGVAAVCAELLPRVGGNPFFLLEMVDALLERGTLEIVERPDGRHELRRNEQASGDKAEALPSTLEQLIGDRIRELPSAEHDVVDWLAVAGGPLIEADILALTRLTDDEAITRLCARGLCDRKAGVVDFRHPLARDVAYLALDGQSRVRMHRLLGEHLATTPLAQGLAAAIVARHLARGEAPIQAAELYLEAASAARTANQAQLAQRYYLRALSLLPLGDARRFVAHESLEAIYRYLGRRRERRYHLVAIRKLARELGQARFAAIAMMRTARLELDEGVLARGLPIAQRAAEIARYAKNAQLEVESLTVLSEILRDLGDTQGAISACDRALEVSEGGGLQPRARAEVLRAKGVLLRYVGRIDEAVGAYAEAIAVFRLVGARRSEARAMTSLAFSMFVSERFEDTIALCLEAIRIDLSIGGRFQIAKTLSNVGQAYAKLGDLSRSLSYLRRAREAHERFADQDSRADTLLCTAAILLEAGDVDAAHTLCLDAGALVAVTGSVYDSINERIVRALLARTSGDVQGAIGYASEARQVAEAQALISFHIYATAIEAAARVDAGEHHTGALLARTALGAVESIRGSEYGVEVRALACDALRRAAPLSVGDAYERARSHVQKVAGFIRDPELRKCFFARTPVDQILSASEGARRGDGSSGDDAPAGGTEARGVSEAPHDRGDEHA